ncbi:hypothetical protein Unana1_06961 [Umbelopsis nana]
MPLHLVQDHFPIAKLGQEVTHGVRLLAMQVWMVLQKPKSIFSTSLPPAEEHAFEEHFKYVIATSGILREVPSTQMAQHTARTTENQENGYAPQAGYQHISPAVFLSPVLLALALRPLGIGLPWLTAVPSTLTILLTLVTCSFFWFRHLKHVAIRKHYATAIARLEQLSSSADEFDSELSSRLRAYIDMESQEEGSLELDRLDNDHEKSVAVLTAILRQQFDQYQEFIEKLLPYVDQTHKSRLFDMYNIDPNLQSGFAEDEIHPSANYVEKLAQQLHWKRRECMAQLLALDIMTEEIDSNRIDYEKIWSFVNTWLQDLLIVARSNTKKVKDISYNKSVSSVPSKQPLGTDSQLLLQKLTALDRDMRRVRDKMHICQNEIRAGSLNPQRSKLKLVKQFESISKDFSHIMQEWAEGKESLMKNVGLTLPSDLLEVEGNELPSPPSSPLFPKHPEVTAPSRQIDAVLSDP